MGKNKITIEILENGYKMTIPQTDEEKEKLLDIFAGSLLDSLYAEEDLESINFLGSLLILSAFKAISTIKENRPDIFLRIMNVLKDINEEGSEDVSVISIPIGTNPHKS